jgi:hypothetical protein
MAMLSSRIAFRGRNQFSNATCKVARPFLFEKLRKNVACNVGFSCQDTAWETLFGWMSFCFQAPSCTTNRQLRWSAPETRSNQSVILVGLARAPSPGPPSKRFLVLAQHFGIPQSECSFTHLSGSSAASCQESSHPAQGSACDRTH